MASLQEITEQVKRYAKPAKHLELTVMQMQMEIDEVRRKYLEQVRDHAAAMVDERAKLATLIEKSPEHFEKPRTISVQGIKVGLKKSKGKTEINDESVTVRLIRKHLADRADTLIAVKESVVKGALANLTAAELKKIGVCITDDTDEVVIKGMADEVEKFIESLVKESEGAA